MMSLRTPSILSEYGHYPETDLGKPDGQKFKLIYYPCVVAAVADIS